MPWSSWDVCRLLLIISVAYLINSCLPMYHKHVAHILGRRQDLFSRGSSHPSPPFPPLPFITRVRGITPQKILKLERHEGDF